MTARSEELALPAAVLTSSSKSLTYPMVPGGAVMLKNSMCGRSTAPKVSGASQLRKSIRYSPDAWTS